MTYGLGIHVGAAFVSIALSRGLDRGLGRGPGQCSQVPGQQVETAVGMQPDGTLAMTPPAREGVLAGRDLRARWGDPTGGDISGRPYSAASLVTATVGRVIADWTAQEHEPPQDVVLTYPAQWGRYQQEQLALVMDHAGLGYVRLASEITALATHAATCAPLTEGDRFAVFDLGGGSFSTAVATLTDGQAKVAAGSPHVLPLGGLDFDEALFTFVDDEFDGAVSASEPAVRAGVMRECRAAKHGLSTHKAVDLVIRLASVSRVIRLTRGEFEGLIRGQVESALDTLGRALRAAGAGPRDLSLIVLTGGSAAVPLVAKMLDDRFRRPVHRCDAHALAIGASIVAASPGTTTGEDEPAHLQVASLGPPTSPISLGAVGPLPTPGRRRFVVAGAAALVLVPLIGFAAFRASVSVGTDTLADPTASAPALRPGPAVTPSPSGSPSASPTPSGSPTPTPSRTPTPSPTPTPIRTTIPPAIPPATAPKATPVPVKPVAPTLKPTPAPTTGQGAVLGAGGLCLGVTTAVVGSEVEVFTCASVATQRWLVSANGQIQNNSICLDYSGGRSTLETCTGGSSQTWRFVSGTITGSGGCLGTSASPGALTVTSCTGSAAQKWKLV